MDRRQRKTREAIFSALIELLSKKEFAQITVSEIIDKADVGRATFYAHFETKDFLLKELCEDLFCHIFDGAETEHRHLFSCDPPASCFLHLYRHLMQNDNQIRKLLSCELFARQFTEQLKSLIRTQLPLFAERKPAQVSEEFWVDHLASVFLQVLRFWMKNGGDDTPESLYECFSLVV